MTTAFTYMKKFILPIALAVLSLSSCTSKADKLAIGQLDSFFTEMYPSDGPGAAILILRDGKPFYQKNIGLADMQTKEPITGDTFFNIASMSKKFTAVAVLQLAEQGKLSLEDPVTKYMPQYTNPIWNGIRIKHLLSHASGLPDARGGIPREEKITGNDSLEISFFDTLSFVNFLPEEKYEYINPTFTLAGRIVEIVEGCDFSDYVREHIFTPAGMEKTLYYNPGHEDQIPNMSHAYVFNKETGEWDECDYGETTFFATRPDGGIYTSVNEYANWSRAMYGGDCRILSPESLKDALTPHNRISDDPREDYGYGWQIDSRPDGTVRCYTHTGGNGGYTTIGAYFPDSRIMYIVFSNNDDTKTSLLKSGVEEILGI